MSNTTIRRWYREPMVWMVIAIPAVAVVLGITLVIISTRTWDGLVVDDYYKEGLGVNQRLERQQRAVDLGIGGDLELLLDDRRLIVSLEGNADFIPPSHVTLSLHHATRSGFDHEATLGIDADNRYVGALPELAAGRWDVLVQTAAWRIVGTVVWPTDTPRVSLGSSATQ